MSQNDPYRRALVRAERGGGDLPIPASDLLPPESRYRPNRASRAGVASTFFFVFVVALALLWFTTSMWPIFLVIVVFFARAFYQRSSQVAAVRENQRAVNLLNAGRVDEAAEIFERLTHTERRTPAHPVYVFNRAVAYMLQGRLKRAYSLFNAVRKSRNFTSGYAASYEPLLYIEMGTCLALMGWLDEAHDYRDRAARRLDDSEWGRLAFLDALLGVRGGSADEVTYRLSRGWRAAEGVLRVPTLKALRLVWAFALQKCGQTQSTDYHSLIEGTRPFRAGEFDWIGANWPEFRAFLQRHGFRR